MNSNYRLLFIIMLLLAFQYNEVKGQEKHLMYGKTPSKIFPYNNFQKAYKYFFLKPVPFLGTGRKILPPKNIKEVRIGFLGPLKGSPIVSLGKQMLNGANLAIEEANNSGGYKGIPFKLMVHNDVGLWGAAANEVVKMDDEKVWVWLGSINGVVSHVALRATLKTEIMMVNTGDSDPTFTETNIPWLIRVISDDRQSGYALASYIYGKMGHKRIAVIRTNSRYGRVGIMEYISVAVRLGHPVMIEERFDDGDTDFKMQLENIKKIAPDGILIWGNAKESALILKQIRKLGMTQPVYGSDRVVSDEFLKIAGKNAEGVVSTCQYNPDANNLKLKKFKITYFKKFGIKPDVFAAHAYDGMNLIIKAIRKVGLNRVLIRDVLTDLKTFQGYKGVTGKIILDKSWNDIGDIYMSKVQNGKFKFFAVPKFDDRKSSAKRKVINSNEK